MLPKVSGSVSRPVDVSVLASVSESTVSSRMDWRTPWSRSRSRGCRSFGVGHSTLVHSTVH